MRLNAFKTGSEETHAVRGRVSGARQRASSHVPSRAGVYEYAEPLNEIHYDVGFNFVVPIYIGGQIMRMCVDTGGGKSMVRKGLVPKLQKRESTRDQIIARDRIIEDVTCAGICNGMSSNKVEVATKINLTFRGVDPEGGKMPPTVDHVIQFGELPDASDALLMGFPDICKLGVTFYQDSDDNVWVDFQALGVTLLAETQEEQRNRVD